MTNLDQIPDQMLGELDEINYFQSPYLVVNDNQDELVLANQYQNESLAAIQAMWLSLNRHIAYLMEDYIVHLLHHKAKIVA